MSHRVKSGNEASRVDRWLWCARFFRARTLATEAVKGGHVRVNGQRIKPSRALKIGDRLNIARGAEMIEVTVCAVPERRGPAAEARGLYAETLESAERRQRALEQRRFERPKAPTPGRPDKTTRRLIRNRRRGDLNPR
jgi:ribosome-associated heat shock protein Hsp15